MSINNFLSNLVVKAKETADDIVEQAEAGFEKIKETAAPMFDKADDFAKETINKVKENSGPAVDQAESFVDVAKLKVEEYAQKAEEFVSKSYESIRENAAPYVEKMEDFIDATKNKISDAFDDSNIQTINFEEIPNTETVEKKEQKEDLSSESKEI